MNDKPITLIVSDLHVGGGPADRGDDHVCHKNQFVQLLREQADTPEGCRGELELFINGDFLEFAQTDQEAFHIASQDCWCTEAQSLRKLCTIVKGHPEIFAALKAFQRNGNLVTLASGNHDVDLYWLAVQARIRAEAGPGVRFEAGREWVGRHDGKLQITHGHMEDVANRFSNWERPLVTSAFGVECLEMCPGTLFMVKFVNGLEARYPFADNLLPVTKLASVLLSDDKAGLAAVGWMFVTLIATMSKVPLTTTADDVARELVARFGSCEKEARQLAGLLDREGLQQQATRVKDSRLTPSTMAEIMLDLLGRIDMAQWLALFGTGDGIVLGHEEGTLAAVFRAGLVDGKARLREVAQQKARQTGARVVVTGHTHQPDDCELDEGVRYYNPGSWTRFLELAPGQRVTLEDLREESRYPYRLNFVRVERRGDDIASTMTCFDHDSC
jgi:UDP-2,3-diacylglucosamine pyrophosphatase LpxH